MSEQEAQNPKSRVLSPLTVLLVLGALVLVFIVAALIFITRGRPAADTTAQTDNGAAIVGDDMFSSGVNAVEPRALSAFELARDDGSTVTLEDLKGKYSVLYFGYTTCPDFCPSTMTDWRLIRRSLGDAAGRFNFVMISVDPARDTPEVLTRYLAAFDPEIIGATGDDTTLRHLSDEVGAFYEPVTDTDTPLYTVEHTASQFVIDPEGNLVTVYAFATPIDVIVADLREKLAAGR